MRAFRRPIQHHYNRSGVALIITLGLLSVLTLLAVAFAIAMRVESMAARNYVNLVRSKHLVRNGLSMAIDDIGQSCRGSTYPSWWDAPPPGFTWPAECLTAEALGSYGTTEEVELVLGEVTNAIPPILLADADDVTTYWKEIYITNYPPGSSSPIVQTNGRVAYLIINASGLLDANYVGGTPRDMSIDPHELSVSNVISDEATFLAERAAHVRYETVQELYALNSAVDPYFSSNLFIHSLDVGKESYFEDTNQLGYVNCVLIPKFNINSITNYAEFFEEIPPDPIPNMRRLNENATFMADYWTVIRNLLEDNIAEAVTRAPDVAWNIVNYLDPDRIPESAEPYPWRNTEGGECTPLINEIALEEVSSSGPYTYRFRVELWYPFAPVDVQPSDNFGIQIGIYSNNWAGAPFDAPNEWDILDPSSGALADHLIMVYTNSIGNMEFGSSTEYLVEDVVFSPPNSSQPISSSNAVWFLCRVVQNVGAYKPIPVDEAMGYKQSDEENTGLLHKRSLMKFDAAPVGYMINDPRVNGQCRYWNPNLDGGTADNLGIKHGAGTALAYAPTLGAFNAGISDAWSSYKSQGIPMYAHTNGVMINISELGHIFRSNLDDEYTEAFSQYRLWRTIDLMNKGEGAALMDYATVQATNTTREGLVTINTRQHDTLHTLFNGLSIANPGDVNPPPNVDDINALVDELIYNGPYMHWRDMFETGDPLDPGSTGSDGGPVAVAMRNLCDGLGLTETNDIMLEAAARSIVELISFRQNIFVVVVAAQTYGRNGSTVVGEQRGIATIIRDSYTGKHFIRNFKWLTD